MEITFNSQAALITGSTEGIGFAIAQELLASGAEVVINGRDVQKTQDAVTRLIEITGRPHVKGIAADLATSKGADELLRQLPEVDILVNNLGKFEQVDFADIDDEQWDSMFQVNVMSGVRLSRAYLPKMLKKNTGRIVFIASECGAMTPPDMIHYGMSKSAQISIARGLAELTRGTGVTVNSILPGPTLTEGVEKFLNQMSQEKGVTKNQVIEEFFADYRPTSIIQRFAQPKEVADTVAFFVSALAGATNGAAIRVEGGTVKSLF